MPVIAKLRYLRIAPRKVRLVVDLIRGKRAEEAQTILSFTQKRAAPVLFKLLKSALANAKQNFQLEKENLYISKITVDEGPRLKRWMPRARGMASLIQKKTSHVTLVLEEIKRKEKKEKEEEKERVGKVKKIKKIMPVKRKKLPELKPEIPKPKLEKRFEKIFRRKAF